MKRTLTHRFALFSVLFLLILATTSVSAQSVPIWTGSISCQLDDEEQGVYQRQEIQTWTLTGAPPANPDSIPIYQAAWQAQAQGQLLRTQPATQTTASIQWVANVPAPGGQAPVVPIAIRFRVADGKMVIGQWRAPMSAPNALNGQRQIFVNGVAQGQATPFSRSLQEWKFPLIEAPNDSTISGTIQAPVDAGTAEIVHRYGGFPTATCQWKLNKGGSSQNTEQGAMGKKVLAETAVNTVGAHPKDSSTSVAANAGPAVYAAPDGTKAPSTASTSSQVGIQVPSRTVSDVNLANTGDNAPAIVGSSPPSDSSLHNDHPAVSGAVQSMATPLPAPTGFTAKNMGDGSVQLAWKPVSGANKYRIQGTGVTTSGVDVSVYSPTSSTPQRTLPQSPPGTTIKNVPPGPASWQIAAVDLHNVASSQTSTATAVVRYVPSHSAPWLSKKNGAGSAVLAQAHYMAACPACIPGATFGVVAVALGLSQGVVQGGPCSNGYGNCSTAFQASDSYGNEWNAEAVYSNITEFNTTRTALCWNVSIPPGSPGLPPRVLCYSKSGDHGLTVISKDMQYAWFMTFASSDPNASVFDYKLTLDVTFDSEGPKHAPHACLSCHGGQWNAGRITGATLLPLDPGMLQVPDNSRSMGLNFLAVNQAVASSGPSLAVSRYLAGLYNGDPRQVAREYPIGDGTFMWTDLAGHPWAGNPWPDMDFVPAGWKQQSDFYKSAVKPHCMMCHLATPTSTDFSTFGNFAQNKELIRTEVCGGHNMPHAEYPYKQFWTKDTGSIFLPGYLAAGVGITSCQ